MIEDFLLRALLGGVGVAAVAGPLGCFVVWRRLAYFGDALAHGALIGVVLGLVAGGDPTPGTLAACLAIALLLAVLRRRHGLASDTLLGILSHAALAAGLVAIGFTAFNVDLMAYLFGDILAVEPVDLLWIYGGGATALAVLAALWRPLLAATVHEEVARAEGAPVDLLDLALMAIMAVFVALAMKVVGVLLTTALLIIPAAAARRFAHTPEQMALLASLIGSIAVALGLAASAAFDTPAGPSVVLAAAALFAGSLALRRHGAG